MSIKPIYLDYAAATPLDERVLASMQPYFTELFYNPSAAYLSAQRVRQDFEAARARIAARLGVRSSEITFTAGATESIQLAIQGVMSQYPDGEIITSVIEHEAVLAASGAHPHHKLIPVGPTGRIDLKSLQQAISDQTVLISIGYINNELGTIQPLREVTEMVSTVRKQRLQTGNHRPLYVHTDASQAAGHIDLHAKRLGVDLLSLNAAKIYGPKQVGLLYADAHVTLQPQLLGGGQERGLRSGTENVAGAIGFATALELAEADRKAETQRLQTLKQLCIDKLTTELPEVIVNGDLRRSSAHILNLSFAAVDGERLLMELDEAGIMVATGSACAANRNTRSHVLEAIGRDAVTCDSSLRLSFGRGNTVEEVEYALGTIIRLVRSQRENNHA